MNDGVRPPTTAERLATQIADLTPMITVLIGTDGSVLFANPAAHELTGFTGSSLVGVDWVEHFVPEHDRTRVRERLRLLGPGDARESLVRTVPTPAGARKVEWWDRVLAGPSGEVIGVLSVGHDVTDRLEADAKLRRAHRRLEEAQRIAGVGTGVRDVANDATEVSDEVYRIFGLERRDRDTLQRFVERVHPADRERAWASVRSVGSTVDSADFEGRLLMDDGQVRYVRWILAELSDGEAPGVFVGAFHDISEFRLTEAALRRTRQHLQDAQSLTQVGSWLFDVRTERLTWSPELYRILGFDADRDDATLDRVRERTHPEDRELFPAASRRALETGEPVELVHRLLWPDGTTRWVRVRCRFEFDRVGEPVVSLGTVQDITPALHQEQMLNRAASQLRDAQALAQIGSWSVDLVTGVFDWSDEMRRIFEIDPSADLSDHEMIETLQERTHPDDLDRVNAVYAEVLAGHPETRDIVHRVLLPGGRVKWVRARSRPDSASSEHPNRLLGTVQDITAMAEQEQTLARVASQLNDAQRLARIGSWSIDLVTGSIDWSDELYRIFEIDGMRHRSADDLRTAHRERIHPDDVTEVDSVFEDAVAGRRGEYNLVHRLLLPDGRVKWVRLRGTPYGAPGESPSRVMGTVQDISDTVEHERRFEQLSQRLEEAQRLAQIGSWTLELATSDLQWSREIYRIFEIDPEQFEATYEAFLAAVHPDDRDLVDAAYRRSVVDRTEYELVHRLQMADGRIKWVREHGRTEYDDRGAPLRSLGTVQDITVVTQAQLAIEELNVDLERRIEERTVELVKARDAAEAANRAKDLFLASMSHEMRTPLNAVIAYAQLIELDDRLPADLGEQLSEVRRAGRQLLALVSDVLDLAKIEADRVDLAVERLVLSDVVEGCLAQVDPLARAAGVEMCRSPGTSAHWVLADQVRLSQVLDNLLSNAVKYNRPGGSVEVRCQMAGADLVRLDVVDTGIGVAHDRLGELFEPFARLGQEMGTIEGSGIGLSVARSLVERMGGSIAVESEPGAGSTFSIELTGGRLSGSEG